MSRFPFFILLFIAVAILLLPAENRSQNLIPGERHHVILCFDANGNQGKIDLTSKAGQEKLREALDSLFVRLQQPESGAETRPIFEPSQHDLATIIYYVPDVRGAGKISNFDFTRDFVFMPPAGSMVAQENLPVVDAFIPIYTEILKNNRRGDALTLYQEASAAGILKLAETQFTETLKPVDKIYLINFYAENINLSSAYNTLDAFIRKTWPDTTDSPGATAKRDSLLGQLSSIKSRFTEIHRNTIEHIYGFRLHYTMAKYNPTPAEAANFLQDPLQDFSFHTADGDNINAELDLKRCLLASRLEQLQPEFWTLLIFGGQAGGDTLAQNFGYWSESSVARVRTSFSRLNAVPKDSLRARTQVIAYATEPLALKARLKSNVLDLKIALPSWFSRNSGWVVPLIVIALFAAGFYVAKIIMARKERRPKVDLALGKIVKPPSKVRIDLDHNTPGWRTVANLKLINATRYNQYQKNLHSRYPIESGEIIVTAKAFCGDQPIEFVLSEEKPLVGIEVSKSGQQFLQTRHESLAIPIREEDEIGSEQRSGTKTLTISLQPELIADVKNCLKLDREVDAELHITATCTGADGNSPLSDTCIVPLQLVRQSAQLEIQTQAAQNEISYDDSKPHQICDFHFAISVVAKEFSMPISGSFILSKSDYVVKEKFPFELFYQDNLIERFELHKLQRGQTRTLSVYVNFGKESIPAPLGEGAKTPLTLRLLLEPNLPSEGISVTQRENLENVGIEHIFDVTPDKRKPHLSIEIAKVKQDYFTKTDDDPLSVFKDDVYEVVSEKETTLRSVNIEFDPTTMDLQTGLTRDPIAKLMITSHRSNAGIGQINAIELDLKYKAHAGFLRIETAERREILPASSDHSKYALSQKLIPRGENQKVELLFIMDWGAFRDALRAGQLSPTYNPQPANGVDHCDLYAGAEVIEFNKQPYKLAVDLKITIEKSQKRNPLVWSIEWPIELSPTKNYFWIGLDYGTSAIAAAFLHGSDPSAAINQLSLQEYWIAYHSDRKRDYKAIDKFLTSRMRLLASEDGAILGKANFVEFVNPYLVEQFEEVIFIPPLKTIITEPHVTLPRTIGFVDIEGNHKVELPETALILRSMYSHLFQNYIIKSVKDCLAENIYQPRMQRRRYEYDNRFIAVKEYLSRFVITVPNSFTPWHIDKLECQLKDIITDDDVKLFHDARFEFLSESDAVAYYYLMKRRQGRIPPPKSISTGDRDEYILIYDQGAGTLDLSYIRLSNIFASGEHKTTIEILSQAGVYAAGNNINYALAEVIENGILEDELKPKNTGENDYDSQENGAKNRTDTKIKFVENRSLLPIFDGHNDRRRFKDLSPPFRNAILLFQIDLESKYKPALSNLRAIEIDIAEKHNQIFQRPKTNSGELIVAADYVHKKFYANTIPTNNSSTKHLVHRMALGIVESLFKLSTLSPDQKHPGKAPLDRVIFSGRSSAFLGLQNQVCEALKNWTSKDEEFETLPLDAAEDAKSAVAVGAVYYATQVLDTQHTVKVKRLPIYIRYVVRESVDGKATFRELLSPHSDFNLNANACTKRLRVAVLDAPIVILYATKKEIDELNAIQSEEEILSAVVEICRVPCDVRESRSAEVELTVMRDTGKLIFTVNGREPAEEDICPPPRNEPGYEEGQWPYIYLAG